MSLFEVNRFSFAYDHHQVLSDLSFHIEEGENFGIIGPNGSGKTTLLKALSGFFSNKHGEIRLQGKPIHAYSKKELAKMAAMVEQEGTPALTFTVEEVVAMGRYPWLKPFSQLASQDYKRIDEALTLLDLDDKRHQPVHLLSGGERQLVSLARAMVQEPKILFLDEPTTYLDIGHQMLVLQHVRRWQKEKGLTVIMVLHDLNLAAQHCDRLLMLHEGKIHRLGKVVEVLQERDIELVYKTKPIMVEHPMNKTPQILLQG